MRKITVCTFMTMDGVIQSPGSLLNAHVSTTGVIVASYIPDGGVKTGQMDIQ